MDSKQTLQVIETDVHSNLVDVYKLAMDSQAYPHVNDFAVLSEDLLAISTL